MYDDVHASRLHRVDGLTLDSNGGLKLVNYLRPPDCCSSLIGSYLGHQASCDWLTMSTLRFDSSKRPVAAVESAAPKVVSSLTNDVASLLVVVGTVTITTSTKRYYLYQTRF